MMFGSGLHVHVLLNALYIEVYQYILEDDRYCDSAIAFFSALVEPLHCTTSWPSKITLLKAGAARPLLPWPDIHSRP